MENQQALFIIICLIMGGVGYSLLKDIFGTRSNPTAGTPAQPSPPEPIRTDPQPPETVRPGGYPVYHSGRDDRYYYPERMPEYRPQRRNGQRVELILDLLDAMERRERSRHEY